MKKAATTILSPGDKINRLTIISLAHKDTRFRKFYNVKCECGKQLIIHGAAIISGNTKSCGCLATDVRKARRISKYHSEITAIILGYKRHATERGFTWNLSREFVEKLISLNCFYCGSSPSNIKKTKNTIDIGLSYSGIDRIDSSKGYEENNVVPCCKICNYAKSNLNIKKFHEWAIKIGKKAMASQWG